MGGGGGAMGVEPGDNDDGQGDDWFADIGHRFFFLVHNEVQGCGGTTRKKWTPSLCCVGSADRTLDFGQPTSSGEILKLRSH